jgi:hypothetical protein
MWQSKKTILSLLTITGMMCTACGRDTADTEGPAWRRHVIDSSSRGADGIRLADVNGDGHLDVATGWEEGGVVRVCLNPGPQRVREKWPSVTVGEVGSPEDAVFVDLDGDGAVDVVSSSTGRVKSVWVHWAPASAAGYLEPEAWKTEAMPAVEGRQQWMFALPLQLDGSNGVDLVLGAKGKGAQVGWLQAPAEPRDLKGWRWHPVYDAVWIMSLVAADMDNDGDPDILLSDRKPPAGSALWLENPGPGPPQSLPWKVHRISGGPKEMMFLTLDDLDQDGIPEVLAATGGRELVLYRRASAFSGEWRGESIPLPPQAGTGKAVRVGDIDLDGNPDIVFSCENAGKRQGLMWIPSSRTGARRQKARPISGLEGIKYDLVELLDLDGDGDLDVLTTEEKINLGVIWHENPLGEKK